MQPQYNQSARNDTGFWYVFDYSSNTVNIGFHQTRAGTLFIPHLNAQQMNTEHAIEFVRLIEKSYIRYIDKIAGRA
jgi:hypothetical protein